MHGARIARLHWVRSVVRIGARTATAVAVGIVAALILYQTSIEPGAAIVRALFQANKLVKPPAGFIALAAGVTEQRVTVTAPGEPVAFLDIYQPTGFANVGRPVILWIHGGGFIATSAKSVTDYAVMLAHAGYTVASLDYSLAPNAEYPVPVRQGNAALAYLRAHAARFGGDPGRIVLGGDSAGAQIASELAAVQTNPAFARSAGMNPALGPGMLRGVVLFCGLYDMRTVGSSGFPALRTYLWAYTGTRDWMSYPRIGQLSTVRYVTANYPPTFLSVGDADPFQSQAQELAIALKNQKVPLSTLFWTGSGARLGHEYQFNFDLPQARTAFQQTVAFVAASTRS
jgi:acetyl esterase/lipase